MYASFVGYYLYAGILSAVYVPICHGSVVRQRLLLRKNQTTQEYWVTPLPASWFFVLSMDAIMPNKRLTVAPGVIRCLGGRLGPKMPSLITASSGTKDAQ